MNLGKLALLIIIVAATGFIVLPNTVSLFHGQHIWYNLSGKSPLPCSKCHYDVYEELAMSAFHRDLWKYWNGSAWVWNGTWGYYPNAGVNSLDCYACHRANASITYASVYGTYTQYQPGVQAHAASVVACMLCHQYHANSTSNKYYVKTVPGFFAGGFANMTELAGSPYNWTGPNGAQAGRWAAHNGFIMSAIKDKAMVDANEACIACHTYTPVNITWHHAEYLTFKVYYNMTVWSKTHYSSHYNATNFTPNGTYTVIVLGNATGTGIVRLVNGTYRYINGTTTSTLPSSTFPGYPW